MPIINGKISRFALLFTFASMDIITTRAVVKGAVYKAIKQYKDAGMDALADTLHKDLLTKKVRFPLLEYAAAELEKGIPLNKQIPLIDKIIDMGEIGGNVIAGIILQQRLEACFQEAIEKAVAYIIKGDQWYVCDIIGERVMGYALLTMPEHAIPKLPQLAKHNDKWIVRSVGVAIHYAVKKGLKKQYVQQMFELLLSLTNTTDFHTKKGVGWAVKTIAKFHPEIIEKYRIQIEGDSGIKQWFRTKIKIGLGRTDKYADRYKG